jgi:hypothetical protein
MMMMTGTGQAWPELPDDPHPVIHTYLILLRLAIVMDFFDIGHRVRAAVSATRYKRPEASCSTSAAQAFFPLRPPLPSPATIQMDFTPPESYTAYAFLEKGGKLQARHRLGM